MEGKGHEPPPHYLEEVYAYGCSQRGVVYFRKLLFMSNKKKFSFRRVESRKI